MTNTNKEGEDKKKSVHERIVKTATRLFYEQGVLNTGVNQIISESNVAKASFYQHFPSKNDLVKECIMRYDRYLTGVLASHITSSQSYPEFMKKWVNQLKNDTKMKYRGCPIAEAAFQLDATNGEMHELIRTIIENWYNILRDFFERMKKKGEIGETMDCGILAQRVLHLHEGAMIMWRLTNDDKYFDDLESFMSEVLKF